MGRTTAAVNLCRVIDLRDPMQVLDDMHLSAAGNLKVAEALVASVIEMLR